MTNYVRSARVWIIAIVLLIGILGTGCLSNKRNVDTRMKAKDGQIARDSLEGDIESKTNIKSTKDEGGNVRCKGSLLKELENQEYYIEGETLSEEDEETIVEFGKAFVNLFHGAVGKGKIVNFEAYIANKNLRNFVDKMLYLTQEQVSQGRSMILYGLQNQFKQANLDYITDNICILELPFGFGGSHTSCKMLITAENKSLKLIDFYFGNKDGIDTLTTGHLADRQIGDPGLWANEQWVEEVSHRLQELEEMLFDSGSNG